MLEKAVQNGFAWKKREKKAKGTHKRMFVFFAVLENYCYFLFCFSFVTIKKPNINKNSL